MLVIFEKINWGSMFISKVGEDNSLIYFSKLISWKGRVGLEKVMYFEPVVVAQVPKFENKLDNPYVISLSLT
jgi:hypothetical protein